MDRARRVNDSAGRDEQRLAGALAGPRIYYAAPLMIGPLLAWPAHLDRIRALGFDTILIAPPFLPGRSGNPFQPSSFDHLHPLLAGGADDAAERFLSPLATEAAKRGLSLFIDLVFDRLAADAPLVAQHPDWFIASPRGEALGPDPRRPPSLREAVQPDFTRTGAAEGLGDFQAGVVAKLVGMGVRGFRCTSPQLLPMPLWRRIVTAARHAGPDVVFCAWTPGVAPEVVSDLADAGFDFSFASTAWWDRRASWLVEEYEARRLSLPAIGLVEEPGGTRIAGGVAEGRNRSGVLRQHLWATALTGTGFLMPQGYEYGAARALDPAGDRPGDWDWLTGEADIDLTADIRAVNEALRAEALFGRPGQLRAVSSPGAPITALLRGDAGDLRVSPRAALILINTAADRQASLPAEQVLPALGPLKIVRSIPAGGRAALRPGLPVTLLPGEVIAALAEARKVPAPRQELPAADKTITQPRVVIEAVSPTTGEPSLAVKRLAGEAVSVEADIFSDGHDKLRAVVLWRPPGAGDWQEVEMAPLDNDRWRAVFPLVDIGRHLFTLEAWRDCFASWREEVEKKHAAGVPVTAELQEGVGLLEAEAERAGGEDASRLRALLRAAPAGDDGRRLSVLLGDELHQLMRRLAERTDRVRHPAEFAVMADRREAAFAAWYELFPRSAGGDPARHGTFDDVIARLPAIRAMGFDVLYMPPIHPIGRVNRKGRNNSLTAGPSDPGSPYAIGAVEGGHDAVHPELGGLPAFRRLVAAATEHGMEIAIDFAIQCSPDHPWLKQFPGWFAWRPDGSIRYAENPPKKYEDIVNVDFYAAAAVPGLWEALRDVVLFWAGEGVRTFRVDNPHTKPLPFWRWMIAEVQARFPDAIFLSEAFTRPKMMQRLAKIGFTQSYTYFTWRNTKAELSTYLTELTRGPMRDYFRPHFFVNTPDINPHFLQTGGRPGHLIRAALATTLSGLWGMYSGFELCEATPLPGKEEYLDSEKYEIRAWDWQRPGNIVAEITALNRIRRQNPALQSHLGLEFLNCWNEQILAYARFTPNRDNLLVVAVSLDPRAAQEASFEVPLWELGLPDDASVAVEDLMRGTRFTWTGKVQQLRLDPADLPFAVWRLSGG